MRWKIEHFVRNLLVIFKIETDRQQIVKKANKIDEPNQKLLDLRVLNFYIRCLAKLKLIAFHLVLETNKAPNRFSHLNVSEKQDKEY